MENDFVKPLTVWYNRGHRDLPWRHTRDPYKIWVSEIMLQQTRVEAVKAYYARFLEALPDVHALAECPDDQLLKLWEGLGYYSRVKNMKKAAAIVVHDFCGELPVDAAELRKLPGIGEYTAGAVASIAFGLAEPAVDGNVMRVFARLTANETNILSQKMKRSVTDELRGVLASSFGQPKGPEAYPGDGDAPTETGAFNQALFELGATVCTPKDPKCASCPVRPWCRAFSEGKTETLPVRIVPKKHREEDRTVLLIEDGERTAVRRRPDGGLLGGLYEFPNLSGRVGEEDALAYVRQNGCEALRIRRLPDAKHVFSHVTWRMTGYCITIAPETDNGGQNGWIFADRAEMKDVYPIPAAFAAYANLLGVLVGKKGKEQRTDEDSDSRNSML
ncbi:MAG: A/G-specific adenine glycosylase [Eubacteriales bacterium]|jgi:A/G-specific adenine glycosylase